MINNFQKLSVVLISIIIVGFSPAFAQSPEDVKNLALTIPEDLRTADEINEVQQSQWTEVGDAGELPFNAQLPIGSGPITSISGTLSFPEDIDMYQICITNTDSFKIETGGMGTADFDTMLSIFDAAGGGIVLNDDFFDYGLLSKIDNTSPFAPTVSGEYLLAIHPFFSEPLDGGATMLGTLMFADGTYWEMIGTVDEWNKDSITGNYEIALDGASYCNVVGGEILPIDTTALLLASIQGISMWMIPILLSGIGIGMFVVSKKSKNS